MLQREVRYLLAAIQAVIAWEWIVSSLNKVLSGTFPQSLGDTLASGIKDNPNGWYILFLHDVVQPHSIFFGYVIEWTEVTIGLVLLIGIVLLLIGPRSRGESLHHLSVGICIAVTLVAAAGAFMCVNFHFWMGKGVIPGVGADPGDEGIGLDALMPPFSLIIILANLYIIGRIRNLAFLSRRDSKQKTIHESKTSLETVMPI